MKNFFLLLFFSNVFNTISGQSIFQHGYGNYRNERCQSIWPTMDGGFLLNGATTSFGSGDVDGLIIKTDGQGIILWSKVCGTTSNEIPTFSIETFDKKFVFIGTIDASSSPDAIIYKTDSAGNFLWGKSFGGSNNENAAKIIELPDHNYVITGNTESYGFGSSDIYLVKTNAAGDTIFTRVYGTTDSEIGKSIVNTSDGGFVICGKSPSIIGGALVYRAILMRIDSTGNLMWTKLYGDTLFQEAQSVEQTSDGGFIVCGSRDFTSNGNYDILLFKTNSSGDIQWSKTYGGNKGEGSYTVNLNEDGTYVLSGYTNSMGFGHRGDDSTNIFLMKTDSFGDTLWTRTYGDSLQEEAFLSAKTPDGGYILSGFSDYHNTDSSQMFVIKTDSLGFSGCNELTSHPVIVTDLLTQTTVNYSQWSGLVMNPLFLPISTSVITDSTYCLITNVNELPYTNSIAIFPNPSKGKLWVKGISSGQHTNNFFDHAHLNVFNMIGEKIIVPCFKNVSDNSFELNVSELKQGVFILEIVTEKEKVVKKFIKE